MSIRPLAAVVTDVVATDAGMMEPLSHMTIWLRRVQALALTSLPRLRNMKLSSVVMVLKESRKPMQVYGKTVYQEW